MEDQVNRKRRSGLLCSKKEIILSRSLGAENTNQRKLRVVANEADSKNVVAHDKKGKAATEHGVGGKITTSAPFLYTELDRKRDEDILKRFDQEIGFDDMKAIELSGLKALPKKRKLAKQKPAKEKPTTSGNSEQEILDMASSSVDLKNTKLKSKETSSEFIVSKSTKNSPARRRVKNTIPSDNFERYLASIVKRYPPMTERDRVMFWKFTPEENEDENGASDKSVEGRSSRSTISRKILENNNENPSFNNDNILFTLNSSQILQSDKIKSIDRKNQSMSPLNLIENGDNLGSKRIYSRREPLRVYGNARQIKQKLSHKDSSDSGFKMPTNPDNMVNIPGIISNKTDMSTAQKEEFYKYLGLETTSPNGKNDYAAPKVNKKRRSLRVKQMQLQQQTRKRSKELMDEFELHNEKNLRKENAKRQKLSPEIDTPPGREQNSSVPNGEIIEIPPNSSKDQEQHTLIDQNHQQRRTCGSVVISLSSGRPGSSSTNVLHIIERIDYSKNIDEPMTSINSPEPYQPIYSETAKACNSKKIKEKVAKPSIKYNTRTTRKNGLKLAVASIDHQVDGSPKVSVSDNDGGGKNTSADLSTNTDSVEDRQIQDIIEVGRKSQAKHMQQKVPPVVSCMEHVTYEKPVRLEAIENKFLQVEMTASKLNEETESLNATRELENDIQSLECMSIESDLLGFDSSNLEPVYDVDKLSDIHSDESHPMFSSIKSVSSYSKTVVSKIISCSSHRKTKAITVSDTSERNSCPSHATEFSSSKKFNKKESCSDGNESKQLALTDTVFEMQTSSKDEICPVECPESSVRSLTLPKPDDLLVKASTKKSRRHKLKKALLKALERKLKKKLKHKLRSNKKRARLLLMRRQNQEFEISKKSTSIKDSPKTDDASSQLSIVDDSQIIPPIDTLNVNGVAMNDEKSIAIFDVVLETSTARAFVPNGLPNPLQKSAGAVLHGFYEAELLIIVQERKVSFWKFFKVIRMFGQLQEWLFLGEHDRLLNDIEVSSPYKNRLCMNDNNLIYVEMRAKQFPNDPFRTCNMASVYVNIYYYNESKSAVVLHSVNLDTIRGVYIDVIYTTITNSRDLIMCWKQENILNTIHTELCRYSLPTDLNSLSNIRKIKTIDYIISQLECLGDDKVIGIGRSQVAIWDYNNGDLLAEFNIVCGVGENLGSIYCPVAFQDYLFLYQKEINEITKCPQLVIISVNLSEHPLEFKTIQRHDLPLDFVNIKSSLSTDDLIVVTSTKLSELLLLVQQPHRLFFSNLCEKDESSIERFYSAGSQYFVEVSEESLIVKTIHEFLLDFSK